MFKIQIFIILFCIYKLNSNELIISNDKFTGYISENIRQSPYIRFVDFEKPKLILNTTNNNSDLDTLWNDIITNHLKITTSNINLFTVELKPTRINECLIQIRANKPDILNREAIDEYFLVTKFTLSSEYSFQNETKDVTIKFNIKILDDNDNDPIFNTYELKITLDEINDYYLNGFGNKIAHVKATDADLGLNAQLRYFSDSNEYNKIFLINWENGEIYLTRNLVTLEQDEFKFDVKVNDCGPKYTSQIQFEDFTKVNIQINRHTQTRNNEIFDIKSNVSIENMNINLPMTSLIVDTLKITGPLALFDLKTNHNMFNLHQFNDLLVITYDYLNENPLQNNFKIKIYNCFKLNSSKCFVFYEKTIENAQILVENQIKNNCKLNLLNNSIVEMNENQVLLDLKLNSVNRNDNFCNLLNDLMKLTSLSNDLYVYNYNNNNNLLLITKQGLKKLKFQILSIDFYLYLNFYQNAKSIDAKNLIKNLTDYQIYDCQSFNYHQYELNQCPVSSIINPKLPKNLSYLELKLINNQNNQQTKIILRNLNDLININHTIVAYDGLIPKNTILFRINLNSDLNIQFINNTLFHLSTRNEIINIFDIKFDLFELIQDEKSLYYELIFNIPLRIQLKILSKVNYGYSTNSITYPKVYLKNLIVKFDANSLFDASKQIIFLNKQLKLTDIYNITYTLKSVYNGLISIDQTKGLLQIRNKHLLPTSNFEININFNSFNILKFDLKLMIVLKDLIQITCNNKLTFTKIDLSYSKWSSQYIRYEKSNYYIGKLLKFDGLTKIDDYELKVNHSLISQILHLNEFTADLYLNDANRNILKLRSKNKNASSILVGLEINIKSIDLKCNYILEFKLKRRYSPPPISHSSPLLANSHINNFDINTNNLLTYVQLGTEFTINLNINENTPTGTILLDLPSYFKTKFLNGKMNLAHLNLIIDSLTFNLYSSSTTTNERHFEISTQNYILKQIYNFDYEIKKYYVFKIRVEQFIENEDINYDDELETKNMQNCYGDCLLLQNSSYLGNNFKYTYWIDLLIQINNQIDEPFVTTWPVYHLSFDNNELLIDKELFELDIIDYDLEISSKDQYKARITNGGEYFYFNGLKLHFDRRALNYENEIPNEQELDVEISDFGLTKKRFAYCKIYITLKNIPELIIVQDDPIQMYDYVFNINKPIVDLNDYLGRIQSNYKLVKVRALKVKKALRRKLRKIKLKNLFFINSNGYLNSNLRHLPCSNCTFQIVFSTDDEPKEYSIKINVNHLNHLDKLLQRYDRKINNSAIVRTYKLKTKSAYVNLDIGNDSYPKLITSIEVNRYSSYFKLLNFIIFHKEIDIFAINQNDGRVFLTSKPKENINTTIIIQIDNHLGQIEFFNLTVNINLSNVQTQIQNLYFDSITKENNEIKVDLNESSLDTLVLNAFTATAFQDGFIYSLINCFYLSSTILLPKTNELCRPDFIKFDRKQAQFTIEKNNLLNFVKNSSDINITGYGSLKFFLDYSVGDEKSVFDLTRIVLDININTIKATHSEYDDIQSFSNQTLDLNQLKIDDNFGTLTINIGELYPFKILVDLNDHLKTYERHQTKPIKYIYSISPVNQYFDVSNYGLLRVKQGARVLEPSLTNLTVKLTYINENTKVIESTSKNLTINVINTTEYRNEPNGLNWLDEHVELHIKLSNSFDYSPIFYNIIPNFNAKNYLNIQNDMIQFSFSDLNSNFFIDSKNGYIYHSSRFNGYDKDSFKMKIQACSLDECTKETLKVTIFIESSNKELYQKAKSFGYKLKSIHEKEILSLDSIVSEQNIVTNNSYKLLNYQNLFSINDQSILVAKEPKIIFGNFSIYIEEVLGNTLTVVNLTVDYLEYSNKKPKWYFEYDKQLLDLDSFNNRLNLTYSFNDFLKSNRLNPLFNLNSQTWTNGNIIEYELVKFDGENIIGYENFINIDKQNGAVYLNELIKVNEIPYKEQIMFEVKSLNRFSKNLYTYSDNLKIQLNFTLNESNEKTTNIRCNFEKDFYHFKIDSSYSINLTIGNIRVKRGDFTYEIESGNDYNDFLLDYQTGDLHARTPYLDHNRQSNYLLKIKALSKLNKCITFTNVFINVTTKIDNDQIKQFDNYEYHVQIPENFNDFESIFEFKIKEIDFEDKITYRLLNNYDKFQLNEISGQLFVKNLIDYENPNHKRVYYLNVNALNHGILKSNCVLVVKILNVNDNRPQFSQNLFKFRIKNGSSFVGKVNAIDLDDESWLNYSIYPDNEFQIDNYGVIRILESSKILLETYNFTVSVSDGYFTSFTSVTVDVESINSDINHLNMFNQTSYNCSVSEDALPGTHVISLIQSKIPDIRFYIIDGDAFHHFSITNDAKLYTSKLLDRESTDNYRLKVVAFDGYFTHEAIVIVKVNDINDNRPECSAENGRNLIIKDIFEDQIDTFDFNARDIDLNDNLSYSLESNEEILPFEITSKTVVRKLPLDIIYYKKCSYSFFVNVRDSNNNVCKIKALIRIIRNSNSRLQPPKFTSNVYHLETDEEYLDAGSIIPINIKAFDYNFNTELTYTLNEPSHYLTINHKHGFMMLKERLDHEIIGDWLNVTIQAISSSLDKPQNNVKSIAKIALRINDINDNLPFFDKEVFELEVPENTPISSVIGHLQAKDKDSNSNLIYALNKIDYDSSYFKINSTNGDLIVNKTLDFETKSVYFFNVTASENSYTVKALVIVKLIDLNDNPPVFALNKTEVEFDLIENSPKNSTIAILTANDLDSNNEIIYRIENGNDLKLFEIDSSTGRLFTTKSIDFEEFLSNNKFELIIEATEKDSNLTSNIKVIVKIVDIYDKKPKFKHKNATIKIKSNEKLGNIIYNFEILDLDDSSKLNYTILILEQLQTSDQNQTTKLVSQIFALNQDFSLVLISHPIAGFKYTLKLRVYDNKMLYTDTYLFIEILKFESKVVNIDMNIITLDHLIYPQKDFELYQLNYSKKHFYDFAIRRENQNGLINLNRYNGTIKLADSLKLETNLKLRINQMDINDLQVKTIYHFNFNHNDISSNCIENSLLLKMNFLPIDTEAKIDSYEFIHNGFLASLIKSIHHLIDFKLRFNQIQLISVNHREQSDSTVSIEVLFSIKKYNSSTNCFKSKFIHSMLHEKRIEIMKNFKASIDFSKFRFKIKLTEFSFNRKCILSRPISLLTSNSNLCSSSKCKLTFQNTNYRSLDDYILPTFEYDCKILALRRRQNKCRTKDNPCKNNALCRQVKISHSTFDYHCYCPNGFTGRHCELDINECEQLLPPFSQKPCTPDATCINTYGSFKCNCTGDPSSCYTQTFYYAAASKKDSHNANDEFNSFDKFLSTLTTSTKETLLGVFGGIAVILLIVLITSIFIFKVKYSKKPMSLSSNTPSHEMVASSVINTSMTTNSTVPTPMHDVKIEKTNFIKSLFIRHSIPNSSTHSRKLLLKKDINAEEYELNMNADSFPKRTSTDIDEEEEEEIELNENPNQPDKDYEQVKSQKISCSMTSLSSDSAKIPPMKFHTTGPKKRESIDCVNFNSFSNRRKNKAKRGNIFAKLMNKDDKSEDKEQQSSIINMNEDCQGFYWDVTDWAAGSLLLNNKQDPQSTFKSNDMSLMEQKNSSNDPIYSQVNKSNAYGTLTNHEINEVDTSFTNSNDDNSSESKIVNNYIYLLNNNDDDETTRLVDDTNKLKESSLSTFNKLRLVHGSLSSILNDNYSILNEQTINDNDNK